MALILVTAPQPVRCGDKGTTSQGDNLRGPPLRSTQCRQQQDCHLCGQNHQCHATLTTRFVNDACKHRRFRDTLLMRMCYSRSQKVVLGRPAEPRAEKPAKSALSTTERTKAGGMCSMDWFALRLVRIPAAFPNLYSSWLLQDIPTLKAQMRSELATWLLQHVSYSFYIF